MRASHVLIEYKPERSMPGHRTTARISRAEARLLTEELVERIQDGESFSDIAQTYSSCPSSMEGGDLGRFGRGQMHSKFEEAAYALEVGEMSGVVETPFGFHIIKRTE